MRFLLIGGIGYLGGRLAAHLKKQGHHVAVTTRRPKPAVPSWMPADEIISTASYGKEELREAFRSREILIHLAAPDELAAQQAPAEAIKAGGELTWNLLESAAEWCPQAPMIYLSTFHIYGQNARGEITEETPPSPVHAYALGRFLGECVVQSFRQRLGMRTLCVRLSNAFGAPASVEVPRWSLLFNDLSQQAVTRKQLILKTSGQQRRNFITLEDAVRALEFLSGIPERWPADGIIHLGSSIEISILEAAEMVAARCLSVLGFTPPILRPEAKSEDVSRKFHFNIDRLASLGFSWANRADEEISNTLRLPLAVSKSSPPIRAAGTR